MAELWRMYFRTSSGTSSKPPLCFLLSNGCRPIWQTQVFAVHGSAIEGSCIGKGIRQNPFDGRGLTICLLEHVSWIPILPQQQQQQLIQDSLPQPALDNPVSGEVAARNPESGCCQKSSTEVVAVVM